MEPIVGIICEYDPFHLGHRQQFELIRNQLPGARILCLMSGCFTQRGMPAVHSPAARAEAALSAGADMVMELPCAFAARDAEHFALGGVEILTRLGFVTHISFGAEDDVQHLLPAAVLLENPTEPFTQVLRKKLNQGLSFAAAQGYALSACLTTDASVWDRPNNILALCYLRALKRLNSPLIPLAVRREGDYHADQLIRNEWPSATAVRRAFREGRYEEATASCGWELPRHPVCSPEALDVLLLHKLRSASAGELALLPDCSEGLENRLKSCAAQAVTREELLELLKTKRYARARLSRLCTHALLGVTQEMLDAHPYPEYVRLLGFRRSADELLSLLKQSSLPVISKAADGDTDSELYRLDLLSYELWALGAGISSGMMFRQRIAIV